MEGKEGKCGTRSSLGTLRESRSDYREAENLEERRRDQLKEVE